MEQTESPKERSMTDHATRIETNIDEDDCVSDLKNDRLEPDQNKNSPSES